MENHWGHQRNKEDSSDEDYRRNQFEKDKAT